MIFSHTFFTHFKKCVCVAPGVFGNQHFSIDLWGMYLKSVQKYCKAKNARCFYYRLSESYRDEFGFPRQRMIIGLGRLEELPDLDQKIQLAERINELVKGEPTLNIGNTDDKVEELAQHFYRLIKAKKKIDRNDKQPDDTETVKLNTLKNKDVREIGAESICYQAFGQLGIESYLAKRGWDTEHISLATTHIISRAVYPASELKTVSWVKDNSAVCELTGYNADKLTKDKLYGITKKLYQEKEGLESHLSRCTNDLFNLHDKIILYDLTNTYFEGRMKNSKKAKFGRSKEKRTDAKIIVLAVVVNTEGFLKYSDIFEGNTTDHSTLETIIHKLNKKVFYAPDKPIVVMDAGIATEDNICFLKSEGYQYLCVSRSNAKSYKADTGSKPVQIVDKREQPIELLRVKVENDGDNYLWVKSQAKAEKENSMHNQFSERFEEGLRGIQNSISKRGGTKKLDKVWERIGRLKEKYPSVHKYYELKVLDNNEGVATGLVFDKNESIPYDEKAGVYFLFGKSEKNPDEYAVYIGEAEEAYKRLAQQQKLEFWSEAVIFISKDENLNKAHVKYLESKLYDIAKAAKRYTITNASTPTCPVISESEKAVMTEFISNLRILINSLGYKVLEPLADATEKQRDLYFIKAARGANGKAVVTNEGIVVIEGSEIATSTVPSMTSSFINLRQKMIEQGVIKKINGKLIFTKDFLFSSPSTAATIVLGRNANGRIEWKDKKGKTLKEKEEN